MGRTVQQRDPRQAPQVGRAGPRIQTPATLERVAEQPRSNDLLLLGPDVKVLGDVQCLGDLVLGPKATVRGATRVQGDLDVGAGASLTAGAEVAGETRLGRGARLGPSRLEGGLRVRSGARVRSVHDALRDAQRDATGPPVAPG